MAHPPAQLEVGDGNWESQIEKFPAKGDLDDGLQLSKVTRVEIKGLDRSIYNDVDGRDGLT